MRGVVVPARFRLTAGAVEVDPPSVSALVQGDQWVVGDALRGGAIEELLEHEAEE